MGRPRGLMQRWIYFLVFFLFVVLGVMLALRELNYSAAAGRRPTDDVNIVPAHHSPPHNFRRPNHVITEYDDEVAGRLATLVERRSTAADPDLIRLIVDMLDPPSSNMIKLSRHLTSTPQSRAVDKVLNKKVRNLITGAGKDQKV